MQTAAAMASLMRASGGGALGLFTAIRRLKMFTIIAPDLDATIAAALCPAH